MTDSEKLDKLLTMVTQLIGSKPVEADIDSQYGDPEVRSDPKGWIESGGQSMKGRRFSACPPEYLDQLAGLLEWQAKKDAEQNKTYTSRKTGEEVATAPLKRKDAARAMAWAQRLRERGAAKSPSDNPEDSLPF